MKRNALSAVNPNLSRAEQLVQWKEAKAQAADVKKRSRPSDFSSDDLKNKVKVLQRSLSQKNAKIIELQTQVETQQATIDSMTEAVKQLQESEFKLKADSKALKLAIQQLKDAVKKGVIELEQSQDTIRALQQRCDEIPALQSQITELSILNRCLTESSITTPATAPASSSLISPTVVRSEGKMNALLKSEKTALQAEIRALQSKNGSLSLRCEELQFNAKLLLQQNAELLENAMKYVAKKDKENRSELAAERNKLTSAMTSLESELTQSLDASMKKITLLEKEIAELRQHQAQTMHGQK